MDCRTKTMSAQLRLMSLSVEKLAWVADWTPFCSSPDRRTGQRVAPNIAKRVIHYN